MEKNNTGRSEIMPLFEGEWVEGCFSVSVDVLIVIGILAHFFTDVLLLFLNVLRRQSLISNIYLFCFPRSQGHTAHAHSCGIRRARQHVGAWPHHADIRTAECEWRSEVQECGVDCLRWWMSYWLMLSYSMLMCGNV
jgi:hypothetical protein